MIVEKMAFSEKERVNVNNAPVNPILCRVFNMMDCKTAVYKRCVCYYFVYVIIVIVRYIMKI